MGKKHSFEPKARGEPSEACPAGHRELKGITLHQQEDDMLALVCR